MQLINIKPNINSCAFSGKILLEQTVVMMVWRFPLLTQSYGTEVHSKLVHNNFNTHLHKQQEHAESTSLIFVKFSMVCNTKTKTVSKRDFHGEM